MDETLERRKQIDRIEALADRVREGVAADDRQTAHQYTEACAAVNELESLALAALPPDREQLVESVAVALHDEHHANNGWRWEHRAENDKRLWRERANEIIGAALPPVEQEPTK